MASASAPVERNHVWHAAGPGALKYLQSRIPSELITAMPFTMRVTRTQNPNFAPIRLAIARHEYEGIDGYIWAYLEPDAGAKSRPQVTMRGEFREPGSSRTFVVPVSRTGRDKNEPYIPLKAVHKLIGTKSIRQLTAFVCFVYLAYAESPEFQLSQHFITIDEGLVDDLTKLCRREKFRNSMKSVSEHAISRMAGTSAESPNQNDEMESAEDSDQRSLVAATSGESRLSHKNLGIKIPVEDEEFGDFNGDRLQAAIEERSAVVAKIDKYVTQLPILRARENELSSEIEPMRKGPTDLDNEQEDAMEL